MGVAREPIIEGDEVHWYYTGCEHTHGETDMEKRTKRIGRATWKRDRFVALRAEGQGEILTKAMSVPEGATELELNADAGGGQIRAELCDTAGKVLKGFSKDGCRPILDDGLHRAVEWQGGDLGGMKGSVKLRLYLNEARVYSFTFQD